MSDPLDLLTRLCGSDVDLSCISDAGLLQCVKIAFSRLDMDGDGLVSWEEWLQVLSAALMPRNPKSPVNPADPLVVRLQGAAAVLSRTSTERAPEQLPYSGYHNIVAKFSVPKAGSTLVSGITSIRSLSNSASRTSTQLMLLEDADITAPDTLERSRRLVSTFGESSTLASLGLSGSEEFDISRHKSIKQLRKTDKMKMTKKSIRRFVATVLPRLQGAIHQRRIERLVHVLRGLIARRRHLINTRKRRAATVAIQANFRFAFIMLIG
jgi:hypothetical protein